LWGMTFKSRQVYPAKWKICKIEGVH
jgi:hypothetical protein